MPHIYIPQRDADGRELDPLLYDISDVDDHIAATQALAYYGVSEARVWVGEPGPDEIKTNTVLLAAKPADSECIYCLRAIDGAGRVPPVDDSDGWIELAQEHADDCDWVATRAHRLF